MGAFARMENLIKYCFMCGKELVKMNDNVIGECRDCRLELQSIGFEVNEEHILNKIFAVQCEVVIP